MPNIKMSALLCRSTLEMDCVGFISRRGCWQISFSERTTAYHPHYQILAVQTHYKVVVLVRCMQNEIKPWGFGGKDEKALQYVF